MPKEFYTERDIEDMVKRGIRSLEINENVVLTDLAYEKANRLGMQLVQDRPDKPPGAPVRPYLSQPQSRPSPSANRATVGAPTVPFTPPPRQAAAGGGQPVPPPQQDGMDLHQRIRNAVIGRLGSQVDHKLLDVIITRVLQNTGIK